MTHQIVLKSRPVGMPTIGNFETRLVQIPEVTVGKVRLAAHTFSVDPYMRGRMSDAKSYAAPFNLDEPIVGGGIARIVESKAPGFKPDDYVLGILPWQEEMVLDVQGLQIVDPTIAPLSYYLGILGMPGLTAYFGLLDIGKPRKGETVVISGAAGAVGMVAGQIAKLQGCHVTGIAGSQAKVDYLVKELGFDAAINYKTETNISRALEVAYPGGIDIYFDNVGGEISDAVITQISKNARIIICGQISLYNATSLSMGPRVQPVLLKRCALMQGFLVNNYASRFTEGMKALTKWVSDGEIKYANTTFHGFETLPEALIALFEGKNTGKLIVEI